MKRILLAVLLCAMGGGAQNLPDAPSAPKPAPFGKPAPGPASSSASVTIPETEALSHVLTRPVQVYPALASVNKIEGDVVLEATIDPQGNVASVKVISGHPTLTGPATAFLKQWLFRPFYSGETRVPAVAQITVRYSLFASQAERDMEKHFQEAYWPAWNAGEEALGKQDYATAKKQFETARDEAAKLGQANWQELANALSRLGSVEYRQKNYPAAEPYLLHALQVQQNHREADAPEIADALGNLAQVYMAENDFAKAEPLLLKAVEIYEAHLQQPATKAAAAGYRRHRVMNLFLLASLNQEMGVGNEATKYCDQAAGDAPQAMAADEAVIVLRTCETVYRKNYRLARAREVEQMAQGLEKPTPPETKSSVPEK
jgi:TonB family protein